VGSRVGRFMRRATAGGSTGEIVGWQLEPRSIPAMEESVQRLSSVRTASFGVAMDGAFLRGGGDLVVPPDVTVTLMLDQAHTTNAYPVLDVSGGAGSTVIVTY